MHNYLNLIKHVGPNFLEVPILGVVNRFFLVTTQTSCRAQNMNFLGAHNPKSPFFGVRELAYSYPAPPSPYLRSSKFVHEGFSFFLQLLVPCDAFLYHNDSILVEETAPLGKSPAKDMTYDPFLLRIVHHILKASSEIYILRSRTVGTKTRGEKFYLWIGCHT